LPSIFEACRVATLAVLLTLACTQTHVVLTGGDAGAAPDASADADGGAAAAITVSIASSHSCAIARGALYCWGANAEGRLGTGDTEPRQSPTRVGADTDWQAVAVSARASLALKRDGSLWAFGANDSGQLGVGDFAARRKPTPVVGNRTDWTAIATRFEHACALARDGSLWCWGANVEGQLGQDDQYGSSTDRPIPTPVTMAYDFTQVDAGQGHSCAIRTDGTLWCWGRNTEGELGQGPDAPIQIRRPVQVGIATDWRAVQGGQNFTCGLRANGPLCWGRVDDATIPGATPGTVIDTPRSFDGPAGVIQISINTFGGCVVDVTGAAYGWGRNIEGQLGLGDFAGRNTPSLIGTNGWTQISVGRFTTCGVRGGAVVCMGDNRAGQLGLGDLAQRSVPTIVTLPP
jgi:alpha-tubulin suppressor-like RCC1 family protein